MTVSFHKYGEYFPGTGELRDIGVANGKYHSVNFPLRDGIDDKSYKGIFEPVIAGVMEYYKPSAVVLQCGGDSLSGDRLGCFNLSMRGHANCVNFVKSFNLPTLVLGGGGYTMRNVARTWAYETGQLVGMDMGPELPFTDYYEYYSPDFELDVKPSNMDNANSPEYLERIKQNVIENLRRTAAPSVQMQDVPREPLGMNETLDEQEARLDDEEADEEANKDRRTRQRLWDRKTTRDDELDESEDEEMAEANGIKPQPGSEKRRGIMDYQNPHAPADDSGVNTPTGDDARSLNGDEDMNMNLDGTSDAQQANAEVQEAVLAAKAKSKSPLPTSAPKEEDAASNQSDAGAPPKDGDGMDLDASNTAQQTTTTTSASASQNGGHAGAASTSRQASAAPQPTPPKSPALAAEANGPSAAETTQTASTAAQDVEMAEEAAKAKEEGMLERDAEDTKGEATTEMQGGGHNIGGGPAV